MPGRARDAALLAPASIALAVLFGGALAGIVHASLVPLGGGVQLDAWRAVAADPAFADAVRFTAQVTLLSTALSALAALALAALLRDRGTVARALVALPVPVPHLLVATLAVVWLGPGGLADRLLGGVPVELVHDRAGLGICSSTSTRRRRFSCCSSSPPAAASCASARRPPRCSAPGRGSGFAG